MTKHPAKIRKTGRFFSGQHIPTYGQNMGICKWFPLYFCISSMQVKLLEKCHISEYLTDCSCFRWKDY